MSGGVQKVVGVVLHMQRQIRDFHFDNFIRMKTDYYNRFYVWSHGVAGLMADVNLRTPDPFGDMNSADGFNFQSTDQCEDIAAPILS